MLLRVQKVDYFLYLFLYQPHLSFFYLLLLYFCIGNGQECALIQCHK